MRFGYAVALVLLFAALAVAVVSGATLTADLAVRAAVHGLASDHLTAAARLFSFIGSNRVWVTATLALVAVLWLTARRKAAFALAGSMAGAVVLENALKLAFYRSRPMPYFGPAPGSYSFPSGHALFATCLYGALALLFAREFKRSANQAIVWIGAILLVLCIGWSRVYLGVHYPSDVLAGYLAGAAWLALLHGFGTFGTHASRTEKRLDGAGRIEPPLT
jgi:membrane-associated phospholipid phosphatase